MNPPEHHSVQAAAGSTPDEVPPATAGEAPPSRREGVLSTRMAFLAVLLLLAVAYTVSAFGMEWRDDAGQIGPGFFPRLVGVAAVLGCLAAIARAMRGGQSTATPVDEEGQPEEVGGSDRPDALAVLATVGCMVVFYFLFEPLGALISSVLFLGGMLAFVNRGHHLANAILSISVPVGLYLLFEVLLDTGLPEGLLAL